MSYAAEHAGALDDIREAGAPVTFRSPDGDVSGHAIQVKGDPETYDRLQLVARSPATFLFAPNTYGQKPAKNSIVEWAGRKRVVQDVGPTAPDGTTIIARIVVAS